MGADKLQQIQDHARAIAALLYEETAPKQLISLEGIELAVRGHILEHISSKLVSFYHNRQWHQQWTQTITQKYSRGDQPYGKTSQVPRGQSAPN